MQAAAQAAKEKMSEPVFSLAASAAKTKSAKTNPIPQPDIQAETRIRGFNLAGTARIGASSWLSSTSQWASTYSCDRTALASLVQRYYASNFGRFMSPDPYRASPRGNDPRHPGSWNRYAYVSDDPINGNDPTGLLTGLNYMIEDPFGGSNPNNDLEVPGGGGDCIIDGFEEDLALCSALSEMGALVPSSALARVSTAAGYAQDAFDSASTPHCDSLFNLPNGEDPLDLLNDPQLHVTYGPLPNGITAETYGLPGSGSATIVFNTGAGSPFLSGSPGANAITLIHELLHAAVDIYGAGAVSPLWIQNDYGNTAAQGSNFALIDVRCGAALPPLQ